MQALLEAAEEKRKLDGNSNSAVDDLEPDAPIYDGPQNGMYKLCEFSDGGFVIWPEFRIRYL